MKITILTLIISTFIVINPVSAQFIGQTDLSSEGSSAYFEATDYSFNAGFGINKVSFGSVWQSYEGNEYLGLSLDYRTPVVRVWKLNFIAGTQGEASIGLQSRNGYYTASPLAGLRFQFGHTKIDLVAKYAFDHNGDHYWVPASLRLSI